MRFDKTSQWIGAAYAEDIPLLREMLMEDRSLANLAHVAFDDPYRGERYLVPTLVFAVAGPPPQQLDWRSIERPPKLELVRLLLEAGADPNIECGHGLPICHVRDRCVAELLIRHGADINRWSDGGGSALFFAIWNLDPSRLEMQLELGADPSLDDPRTGESGLHVACLQEPESREREADLLRIIELLLQSGADPVARTMRGTASFAREGGPVLNEDTPLHLAAGFAGESVVRMLVERGFDTSIANAVGETPIDIALKHQRPAGILELLRARTRE